MRIDVFVRRSRIPASAEAVFRWHEHPDAVRRLTHPASGLEVVEGPASLCDGARTVFRVRLGPLRRTWVSVHEGYVDGRRFVDRQVQGPFAHFVHTHTMEPDGPDACFLEDRIEWALPLGWLGRLVAGRAVRRRLERTFAWRHAVTAEAFAPPAGAPR